MIAKNKVWFAEDSHSYYSDKEQARLVPGYSGIIKEVLGDQFLGIPLAVLENARDRGIAVHKATEEIDRGGSGLCLYPGHVLQWVRFKRDFGIEGKKFDLIEQPLLSMKYWFCGTPDRIIGDTLIDIKTPMKQNKLYRLQTMAYKLLYEENFGIRINKRLVVHLGESCYKTSEYKEDVRDFEFWEAIVKTFKFKLFEK